MPMRETKTVFSPCGKYRYLFQQHWNEDKPCAMFIGLNPTEIDPLHLNATLRRCINYAQRWQYGGVCIVNLFARLAASPAELRKQDEPIGKDNDYWLKKLSGEAGIIIAAWGNDGNYLQRSKQACQLIDNVHCLKINRSGEPAHPLYQPAKAIPIPFTIRSQAK